MELQYALDIFSIQNINKAPKDDVKKKYRALMKKNHPDIGGDENKAKEIAEAYKLIANILAKIDESKKSNTTSLSLINFNELVNIYSGKEVNSFTDSTTINNSNLRLKRVMLNTEVSIEINGFEYIYKSIIPRNDSDVYNMVCGIKANTFDDIPITIKAYNKKIENILSKNNLCIVLSFDYNVKLKISIERQLIDSE